MLAYRYMGNAQYIYGSTQFRPFRLGPCVIKAIYSKNYTESVAPCWTAAHAGL